MRAAWSRSRPFAAIATAGALVLMVGASVVGLDDQADALATSHSSHHAA